MRLVLAVGAACMFVATAHADVGTGSLRGQVRDAAANGPAAGATIVATSPAMPNEQVAVADDQGRYSFTELPAGTYTLTTYYDGVAHERGNVLVQRGNEGVVNISVDSAEQHHAETIQISAPITDLGYTRGRAVAEDYLVLPTGYELGGDLRTITADGGLGARPIKLTDVGIVDASVEWAVHRHIEIDASASVLAKQPADAGAAIFQGGSLTLRRDLFAATALAVSASAGPLVGFHGLSYGAAAFATHKHRLNEIVSFSLALGANAIFVRPSGEAQPPTVLEAAGHAAVLVRVPNDGVWGGWLGAGYALPVFHHGNDPVSGMALDPQPRLDIDIGNGVRLSDDWDLTASLSIIDRGDLGVPATRLPILDGGFDQIQIMVGVSRRFGSSREPGDPAIQL
jgi:hypothetical protein